jgi:multiple sugar transport system substrate-binding protein
LTNSRRRAIFGPVLSKRFDEALRQSREEHLMSEQGTPHDPAAPLTRRRFLGTASAAAAAVLAPGLAACAGGNSGGSSKSSGSGGGGNGKVTLTWWDYFNESNEKAVNDRIAKYQSAHPNVTIKRTAQPFADLKQKLLQGATAGELPDIVVIDNPDHSSFAALGVLADVTDHVKSWGQESSYYEGPWKSTVYQGRNYGVPDNSNCLALWSNTAQCKAAGVDVPADWESLKTAVKTLTAGKTRGIAMSAVKSEEGTFQWLPFLWAAGADLATLDSDGGRAALALWTDFVKGGELSKSAVNWDQLAVMQQFANERAALMVNGPWQIPGLKKDKPKLKWDVSVLPKGQTSASILGGENIAITKSSKHVDAAWEFIQWTQEPENLRTYNVTAGKIPSRKDVAQGPEWTSDPAVKVFVEQLNVARPRAYGPKYPEASAAVQEMLQSALTGSASVDAAVKTAAAKVKPLLQS